MEGKYEFKQKGQQKSHEHGCELRYQQSTQSLIMQIYWFKTMCLSLLVKLNY